MYRLLSHLRHPIRTKPLRVKLMATVLVLLTVAMTLIGVASVTALRRTLMEDLDNSLAVEWDFVSDQLIDHVPDITTRYYGAYTVDRSNEVWKGFKTQMPTSELPQVDQIIKLDKPLDNAFTVTAPSNMHWRVLIKQMPNGQRLMIMGNQYDVDHAVQRLVTINLFGGISVLLFAATIGAELIRRSLRPLSQIEKTASAIAAGDLSQRVPDPEPENPTPNTEVGSLARSLNSMLAQIEAAFMAQAASEAAARDAEQSARSSEERMRRFVADASHELRTPLTTIRGFAELYRQGAVTTPEKTAEVIQRIENEASRMGLLVEDLLLLARLDRERPLRPELVELRVLATEAVEAARVVAPDRDISLVTAPDAGHLVVSGDDARLRQVIGNLVGNALTHTPAGTPVIVRLASRDGMGIIEIHDRGPGLSPQQQERVFERFYRADPARTRRADGTVGTGLGLAIVAALVAAHAGTVEVESQPGVGATFRVLLPLAELFDDDMDGDMDGDAHAGDAETDRFPYPNKPRNREIVIHS